MIENYKGWIISLNWYDEDYFFRNSGIKTGYKEQKRCQGVNFNGNKIYGSSLKEIRHIIDYPNLHN